MICKTAKIQYGPIQNAQVVIMTILKAHLLFKASAVAINLDIFAVY